MNAGLFFERYVGRPRNLTGLSEFSIIMGAMDRAVKFLGVLMGTLTLVGGCALIPSEEALRYRMTVIIDTPDGPRVGSSVIESSIEKSVDLGIANPIHYRLKGEAVPVQMPTGKVVFALLLPQDMSDGRFYHSGLVIGAACLGGRPSIEPDPSLCAAGQWRQFWQWARENELLVEIAPSEYPLLVTFSDAHDPSTVSAVDPTDFRSTFGPGYRLRSVTAQVTADALTTDVEKILPTPFWKLWSTRHQRELAKGGAMDNPYFDSLMGSLSRNDFTSKR